MSISALVLLAACGTPDERATNNGKHEMQERYAEIKHELGAELQADDVKHAVEPISPVFPEIYASSWNGETAEWRLRLQAKGRDPQAFGEHDVVVGTCIKVRGRSAQALKETTVKCPKLPADAPQDRLDVEVDILH